MKETEAGFQQAVLELAKIQGWRAYHTFDSRHSTAGFPDLVLVRPPRMLFVELKTARGLVTDKQASWLEDLIECGMVATVWRPSDWPSIQRLLSKATGPVAQPSPARRAASPGRRSAQPLGW